MDFLNIFFCCRSQQKSCICGD